MNMPLNLWQHKPKVVVFIWLLIGFGMGLICFVVKQKKILPGPSTLETLLNNPQEKIAYNSNFAPKDSLTVLISSSKYLADTDKHIQARKSLVDELKSLRNRSNNEPLFNHIQTIDPSMPAPQSFISSDLKYSLITIEPRNSLDRSAKDLKEIPKIFSEWENLYPDFELLYLSEGTFSNQIFDLIDSDLDSSLIYTLPVTFLILVWAFGSFAAASIPLLMAIVSLICSLGFSALFSHVFWPISATASQLVVLLVLAIGIDYSLFMISRVREEVKNGAAYSQAVILARDSTGLAIMWSGLTVAISLLGLFLMSDTVLTSMALVSIISVVITVAGALFVLPAILLLLGHRIESCKIFRLNIEKPGRSHILSFSIRYPVFTLLLTSSLLLFLAYFSFYLKLGSTMEPTMFPAKLQSARAYAVMQKNFPDIVGVNFYVIIQKANPDLELSEDSLQPFLRALTAMPGVKGPLRIERSEDQLLARYHFVAIGSANTDSSQNIIHSLRSIFIPELLVPIGLNASVGGTLPYVVDDIERYSDKTPLVFAGVIGLSFIFLLVAFRSLIVPVKAMLLNILSTSASFGVLVIAFQLIKDSSWNYGVIESFVPALLFSILFGLSMDYHVFLLSRVSEEVQKGKSTIDAVKLGIQNTSKTINSAALIMVSVFIVISTLSLPIMKELGLGLAVAVFLDATIIRSMLLPASMVLLGKHNWYLPKCLEFLPKIKLG